MLKYLGEMGHQVNHLSPVVQERVFRTILTIFP